MKAMKLGYCKISIPQLLYKRQLCCALKRIAMEILAESNENVTRDAPLSSGKPAKMPRIEGEEKLLVKKLSDKATLPKRGSAGAAGYDLSSAEDTVIPARGKALVKTDISIRVPKGTYGRVAPRSGLAAKNFIDTGAGVIDEDYRGNVGVLLFNHSDTDFPVKVGDRVAQLVLEKITTPDVEEVEELDATERGANGYGSTGVAAS
ncbi:hypothetical protein VOLCADRAFT_109897 [Volvox carteri f. nagariensis]|uniref:Deoxyuridine 5'-triphosphate nucleotidohydrolase n=1 Tax=Volvox carteri f. nagariensis TaxID=3068 RepID=D8U4X9_VOLCA|nr:uncharacterized protein VOLCADRAFT_109897 [Volvox carteri f. nagariensis]EFJ45270.1 hypothetical protein VOLCADRAFT_109897 [Volvox carteri f. nagariensis]|eukprot:XP_002953646.1 hypothetical protein VOLCADRAFT_109897 [Volvox carteri f. nagariensis]